LAEFKQRKISEGARDAGSTWDFIAGEAEWFSQGFPMFFCSSDEYVHFDNLSEHPEKDEGAEGVIGMSDATRLSRIGEFVKEWSELREWVGRGYDGHKGSSVKSSLRPIRFSKALVGKILQKYQKNDFEILVCSTARGLQS
jgi:hypothetical protein